MWLICTLAAYFSLLKCLNMPFAELAYGGPLAGIRVGILCWSAWSMQVFSWYYSEAIS